MSRAAVDAAERRQRALELVLGGHSYAEVARRVGYRSKGSVSKAVWATLHARQVEHADELRALELSRLDALQKTLWDKAMSGDVKAVDASLRIIERRAKVLGLDRLNGPQMGPQGFSVVDPGFWEQVKAEGKSWEDVDGEGRKN